MRRSIVGGLLLAGMVAGPVLFAGTAMAEEPAANEGVGSITVEVESSIQLTMIDDAITLEGLAAATGVTDSDNQMSYKVETNNITGYAVSVIADQENLLPADTQVNTDVIPVSAITVANDDDGTAGTATAGGVLSDQTAVDLYSQAQRSIEGGDTLVSNFEVDIPFVNADSYTGTVTFTAVANS